MLLSSTETNFYVLDCSLQIDFLSIAKLSFCVYLFSFSEFAILFVQILFYQE